MTTRYTVYEQPLNERIRTLLRLEHLFSQAFHFNQGASIWDSRMMITTLFDLLDLFSRADLKTEIIKEVDRATSNLNALLENPAVDGKRLSTILKALQHITANLHNISGQLGQTLRQDEFLASIRQRSTIPGGTCDFDLPGYHHWLEQPSELRQSRQQLWLRSLEPIQQAVELLLKLNRNSAEPQQAIAEAGQYQQQLENNYPYQMIRVFLPHQANYYPEISGSKHMFTIRFLHTGGEHNPDDQGKIMKDDLPFQLALCLL
ncbi:MAG: cell division protein ZapD [Gammaproteobacteria bacterium]|nr:cell division protein ZapD [Gammaproteobacteria bacterium]